MQSINLTEEIVDAYGGLSPRTKERASIVRSVNQLLRAGRRVSLKMEDNSAITVLGIRQKHGVLQFRSQFGWESIGGYHPCKIEF